MFAGDSFAGGTWEGKLFQGAWISTETSGPENPEVSSVSKIFAPGD
jgi:hypothetical protein